MTTDDVKKSRKKRSISSFSILLIMLVALAIITAIMGAAGVEGVTGATIANVVTAPVLGFEDAIGVCIFVFVLGGFLGIVTETGALDAGIAALVHKLHGKELWLIPILMAIFSIGGTTYGMCEETVPFYLLLAATMVAAGFDSLTGAAVVLLGAGVGVMGSTVNPFAVGVAVDALTGIGVAVNQGIIIALGLIIWLTSLIIAIIFVMRYAKKVKADKGSTFLSLQEQQDMMETWGMNESTEEAATDDTAQEPKMTGRQKWSLVVFALTFVVMIVAFIPWEDLGVNVFVSDATSETIVEQVDSTMVSEIAVPDAADPEADPTTYAIDGDATTVEFSGTVDGTLTTEETVNPGWSSFLTGVPVGQWYFNEASCWFFLMALIIGLIGGVGESRFVKTFLNGAADMMSVVLIIAVARSITILMGETGLDIWILDNAANALNGMAPFVFAPLSFLLYIVLSFLIPSSSGMATVSMPILGGLAAKLNLSVETMVMIYSAGNGLVNLFTPTSGAIMGGLALAKVDYTTWLKFGAKLFIVLGVVCVVILTAAMVILS
ncbi:YfcC family protein [Parvibacter caecicola]|mgnify:CR=1 FL=1|uniref:Putative ion transporter superfamily protein YfcC n=1 Tax=Parvibacter caecicola TaxID=747645 RepID=A0A3N0A8A8_9ACTN|nr:YfcC family protein [Parvibacter caecicola]MBB3170762.1 putative ion transporter superfamily protein YfcC [Parvibacter caecicola]MCR2041280.1 YfcC family protein [Parvibacter caecicola]RNL09193.1 YfcC family protein [Parvibacter caecicola]TJW12039.1 YfcC family protein [Parvibacter caecicola]